MTNTQAMHDFAAFLAVFGIMAFFLIVWDWAVKQTELQEARRMETLAAREIEFEIYRDALTAFANMTVLGMPVNVSLRSDEFQEGFALAVQTLANLAEDALNAGETVSGPGVNMTEEEIASAEAAVARIEAYTKQLDDA